MKNKLIIGLKIQLVFRARVGGENQLHFSRPHRDWKLKSVNAAVEHFKIAVTF